MRRDEGLEQRLKGIASECRVLALAMENGTADPRVVAALEALLRRLADDLYPWRQLGK